jgi:hypothetical protein
VIPPSLITLIADLPIPDQLSILEGDVAAGRIDAAGVLEWARRIIATLDCTEQIEHLTDRMKSAEEDSETLREDLEEARTERDALRKLAAAARKLPDVEPTETQIRNLKRLLP